MVAAYAAVIYAFSQTVAVGTVPDATLIPEAGGIDQFRAAEPTVDRRATLLVWCFIFWIVPMYYFIAMMRESFAATTVEHIGPMSAHIEDPSQFAAARKLALRGDVDGAVSRYLSYTESKADAMFEAARLLKSEDRYEAAEAMLEQIAGEFTTDKVVWAEAVYQLAKLKEVAMGKPGEAMDCLRRLLQRAPETRFGELASADLSRLQALNEGFTERAEARAAARAEDSEESTEASAPKPPRRGGDEEIPDADPFYLAALQRQKEASAERRALGTATSVRVTTDAPAASGPDNGSHTPASAATDAKASGTGKAKPAAKKKSTAAKKKPAAKKKAAPKKKATASKKAPAKKKLTVKKKAAAKKKSSS
jgi:tetratricopeptide (TPR) repeat protein